ncbi:AEC family transporter [Streptosporangium pseudovulgare]|uniref:Membrane protein n=1 Tax=Streptosporangium pseudovulgare TaxID=35765 RepID=A0ABQ2QVV0_9ACTN|nr:AEC family transporter [Streptosporangium pseudovulgare]GGQ00181.1 membrane protein [Streptosporangium pseudovulgare]
MQAVISAFAPIWLIGALGWLAARSGWAGEEFQRTLTRFAFTLAMPAVLFGTLSRTPLDRIQPLPLLAFAVSTFAVGLAALTLRRGKLPDRVVAAMASAYVNSGNLGIPVGLYVLHDATFVVSVMVFQVALVSPLIFLGLGAERPSPLAPLRTPIVVASLLGLGVSALGLHPPELVTKPLEILGGAAVPLALFSLGMSLNGSAVAWRGTLPVVALKLLAQPLVAFLAGRFLLHLDDHALFAAVLFAGLPTAQNTYVYAVEYGRAADLPRDAILVSSVLSPLTLAAIVLTAAP